MKHIKHLLLVLAIILVAFLMVDAVFLQHPKAAETTQAESTQAPSSTTSPALKQALKQVSALTLVNKTHNISPDSEPMVSVFDYKSSSYLVKDRNVLLNKTTIDALNEMLDDFYEKTGLKTVNVISGFRTKKSQQEIYDGFVESDGAQYAKEYVQTPGSSEHHTGYALDLGLFFSNDLSSGTFRGDGDYSWITENSWKYGFVLRYPESKAELTGISYEPWHFRYVGLPHSKYISENDLCLEEYIKLIHSHKEDNMLKIENDATTYGVFFSTTQPSNVEGAEIVSVDADNAGGFIVTCILP